GLKQNRTAPERLMQQAEGWISNLPPAAYWLKAQGLDLAAMASHDFTSQGLAELGVGSKCCLGCWGIAGSQCLGQFGDVAVFELARPLLCGQCLTPYGANAQTAEGINQLAGAGNADQSVVVGHIQGQELFQVGLGGLAQGGQFRGDLTQRGDGFC